MPSSKISIIIPIYNAEKYLVRCLDSILAQTFTDYELLLIDDGSKDSSGKICDEYAEKYSRIRVFHKSNGGASSARNVGLDNACGEWIAFADADDYVSPNWLSVFINIDECDLKTQGIITDKPFLKNLGLKYAFEYEGNACGFLKRAFPIRIVGYLFCKLFRASIIKDNAIRFDESVRYLEDELFVVSYLKHCNKIVSVNKTSYYYFVPNWDKYGKEKGAHNKHRDMIAALDCIERAKETEFYSSHIVLLVQCLIQEFTRTNNIKYLKELRSIHIDNNYASGLNPISKWILINDKSLVFSSLVIRLAHKIGRFIHH